MRWGRGPRGAGILLLMGLALVAAAPGAAAAGETNAAGERPPVRVLTGKERLSGKAADEQRVDNCKVPSALRGPKPRPDDCRKGAREARPQ